MSYIKGNSSLQDRHSAGGKKLLSNVSLCIISAVIFQGHSCMKWQWNPDLPKGEKLSQAVYKMVPYIHTVTFSFSFGLHSSQVLQGDKKYETRNLYRCRSVLFSVRKSPSL